MLSLDGDNDEIGMCVPPIKLFCISAGPGVPELGTGATFVEFVDVCVNPPPPTPPAPAADDKLVEPTFVGVLR